MSQQTWQETIAVGVTDGPTLTTAARSSCIPVANRITLPNNFFYVGRILRISASGRISCVVTTPGTCRFDICLGAAGTTIVYDTGAIALNIVAKVAVPWYLELRLVCRTVGAATGTTFFPHGCSFQSEAVVGSALPAAGGAGSFLLPTTAPAVGAGFDNNAASILDMFHTQTVATGQMILHNFQVDVLN